MIAELGFNGELWVVNEETFTESAETSLDLNVKESKQRRMISHAGTDSAFIGQTREDG